MAEARIIPIAPRAAAPAGSGGWAPQLSASPPLALYVHFPWCVQKCPYCDFNSHAVRDEGIPEAAYLAALVAVNECVFQQVGDHAPGQRRIHPHKQMSLLMQFETHFAPGVDLLHILGHTSHLGVEVDLFRLGELSVLDLRKQQQRAVELHEVVQRPLHLQYLAELRLAVPDTGAEIIHLEAERQRRQQRESERARRPDESALGAQIRNMKADAEERAKSAPPNAFAQEVEQALAERRKAKAQERERGRIQHGEGGVIRHTPVEASEKLIHEQIAQARERREQERQAERERLRAAERHQEQQRIERMNAAELRAEIERQRPAPVAELVERDPAVIEATRTHRTLAGQVQALQGRANEAHREAQAWREAHPIRAKAHDAGVMRAAYLDERAQVIEQARAEYQKVAPQATRAREVAESVRNATTTRIAQEQAPALARIRALEQRAAELERIERERQAQALREQQAEGEARLLVRDMREMADSLRCGAPGWTEDGHQLQALYAPENKDALTMVEGLAALPLEEQRDYVAEQLVARLAKDPAARLRLAEQVERVQRGPEQDHDYGMSL